MTLISSKYITIDTQLGDITGLVSIQPPLQTVYSFLGIQYGVAPINELRFRQTIMNTTKWNGIYNATIYGPCCIQPHAPAFQSMNESCLYLNIYTSSVNKTARLPVMIFIHGGGFYSGAGSLPTYNGTNFVGIGGDMVYVSINYRLGPLGFLANEAIYNEDPNYKSTGGLNGIYDQITAIKWVKEYITDYGGNSDDITIFGESAGGMSVCILNISPLGKGLFKRSIIESGECIGPWGPSHMNEGIQYGNMHLMNAGYPTDNLTYLRQIDAQTFVNNVGSNTMWYGVSVDGLILQDIPNNIYSNINENGFNSKEIILGFNTMDGVLGEPYYGIYIDGEPPVDEKEYIEYLQKYLDQNTAELVADIYYPIDMFPPYNDKHNSAEITWYSINSDVCLTCPTLRIGNYLMDQLNDSVSIYVYLFGGPGKDGKYYAPHASELAYVFGNNVGANIAFQLPWDPILSRKMTYAWTNFGKTGTPTINNDSIIWEQYNGNNVILFQDNIEMIYDFNSFWRNNNNVCQFWYNNVSYNDMYNLCIANTFDVINA